MENSKSNLESATFNIFILFPIACIINSLYDGYTLIKLYNWFIINTFHLPILTMPIAIGITLFMEMFQKIPNDSGEKNARKILLKIIYNIITKNSLLLILGYIVHKFI